MNNEVNLMTTYEESKKTLLGCELCETWKPSNEVSLYNGMFICDECASDPDNMEYTLTDGID